MTYVGMIQNKSVDFQTLVLAESDEEAKKKIRQRFANWWGDDAREEEVRICAFGDGHRVL